MTQIPEINLNQNLWALLISLTALGTGEFYCLYNLKHFGFILSTLTGISYVFTLIAYTINYWNQKVNNKR